MIAILPAAGKGTRMADVTGGGAKELLAVGGRSVLARVMQEAVEAGASLAVVVVSPEKEDVAIVARREGRRLDLPVEVRVQETPRGLGHAVACAGVEGEALVLLPDCLYRGRSPSGRLANLVARGMDAVLAVEAVSDREVGSYGIVEVDEGLGAVTRILEKPRPEETTSRWAVAARYALGPRFLELLAAYADDPARGAESGEINLSRPLQAAIDLGFDVRAVPLTDDQERVDCGTPEEYAAATRLRWP